MSHADAKNRLPTAKTVEMYSKKLDGYAGGYGTVLFFENQATIDAMACKFPFFAGHFSTRLLVVGMLQHTARRALTAEELGANMRDHGMHGVWSARELSQHCDIIWRACGSPGIQAVDTRA